MNVLFIGNSYTSRNNMPVIFAQLAISNGKNVTVHKVTKGGRKLFLYADDQDPATVALDTLLAEQTFDICFIQEQSVLPAADFDSFIRGLDCVVNKLKGRAEHIILFATWGRKSDCAELAQYNWTSESMAGLLAQAYQKAAERYGFKVSPAGNNFMYIAQNYPEINLYADDGSHPSYLGSCLVALTHYHTVFGAFPDRTDALLLSDAELSAFKSAFCR